MELTLAEQLIRRHGLNGAFDAVHAAYDGTADLDDELLLIDLRSDSEYQDLLDDLTDFETRTN
jgi:hypothetical protein